MKQNLLYSAPESEALELRLSGVIAASEPLLLTPMLDAPFGAEDTWTV